MDAGAVAIVTHVSVQPDDPAFDNPTKPIGPFLSAEEAKAMADARGWVVRPDAGRGFRRVVPSPQPVTILETPAIRAPLEVGQVVVAGGGGGVPVVRSENGFRGIDAVIDKDYAAQQLATVAGRRRVGAGHRVELSSSTTARPSRSRSTR